MGNQTIVGRALDHIDESPTKRFLPAPWIEIDELADEYRVAFAREHARHTYTAEEWKSCIVEKATRLEERSHTSRGELHLKSE
ncbi:hypothetical protein ACHAO1_006229 [Botrytis cinerea]